jgi:hypothetical protein
VGENGDAARRADTVLIRSQRAADHRTDAEHVEEVAGHDLPFDPLGGAVRVEGEDDVGEGGKPGERTFDVGKSKVLSVR